MEKKSCPGCGGMFVPLKDGGLRAHGPVNARCTQDATERCGTGTCKGCGKAFILRDDRSIPDHECAPAVSDPAPTVEETTIKEDDVAVSRCDDDACVCGGDGMTDKGPWFGALYEGRCSVSECRIEEGDRIRADGEGGYECEGCVWDDPRLPASSSAAEEDCGDDQAAGEGPITHPAGHCAPGRCVGCCGCSSMCTDTPCGPPAAHSLADADAASAFKDPVIRALGGDIVAGAAMRRVAEQFPGSATVTGPDTSVPRTRAKLGAPLCVTADEFMDPAPPVDRSPGLSDVITADEFMDPAATEDVKPILSVSGQPKKVRRDHMKRYAVVLPGETELETYKSSGKPVGRTRATTFNKAATDKKNINDWGKRNVVIGASRRRDLLLKAQGLTHEDDRDRLNAIVVELEEAAGSKVGSDLGTYLHEFTEYMDAGLKTWRDAPEEFRESLRRYVDVLKYAGLEPIRSLIERTTIIREYGWVCGTFDRIFFHRPSGQYVIGDLKTGKTMDYGKNEVECQLWTYAHGVNQNGIYDWNTDTWVLPDAGPDLPVVMKVSETVGVVIHMPVQGPKEGTVELLWADLENGREHAAVCAAVRARAGGKMKAWGDGPAPLAPLSWTDRFRAVTTNAEASALWREAKAAGVKGRHLEDYIDLARQSIRLRSLGMTVKG